MKRNIFVFGLIGGLLVALFMLSTMAYGDRHPEASHSLVLGYASMVVGLSLVFVGVKNYRDRYKGGSISFGQAAIVGLWITAVASTIYVIIWLIDLHVFIPDFMDKYAGHMIREARASGGSQAAIDKQVASINNMKEMYKNPIMVALLTYLEIVPVGIVISLLAALLLKRKQRPVATPAVAG